MMVKSKSSASLAAAAAAAAVVSSSSLPPVLAAATTGRSTVASCRIKSHVLPASSSSRSVPLKIPRGGATKDDKDNEEKSSAPQPDTEKSHHGKKKKKRKSRKKEKEENGDDADSSSPSSSKGKEKPTDPSPTAPASAPTTTTSAAPPPKSPMVEKILKEDDYYKVLGITQSRQELEKLKNAESIIKKHYRKRALQTHPDKTGGDRRAFDKVAEAYDVLSDPDKRQIYNRFGKKGLDPTNHGVGGGASGAGSFAASRHAEELFRSFFGGSGGSPFQQQQQQTRSRRNRTARYQLEVTLEDMYRGLTRDVLVAPPPEEEEVIMGNMRYRRTRPQSQHVKPKSVHVHVPRGALDGQNIVLSGEMDFDANETPGDVIFSLSQRPHATFTRKGYDLAMTYKLSLRQALVGHADDVVKIRHLNGKEIPLHLARQGHGQQHPCMIHDGDVQVIKGLGMPKDAQGATFGDLYIQFKVTMPAQSSSSSRRKKPSKGSNDDELTLEEREELGRLLDKLLCTSSSTQPSKGSTTLKDDDKKDEQFYLLQQARLTDFGRASGRPRMPSHHDEHDHLHADEHDHYQQHNPFGGSSASQFFFSSMSGGRGNPFFNAAGASPFGDEGDYEHQGDNDEDVQCRQM